MEQDAHNKAGKNVFIIKETGLPPIPTLYSVLSWIKILGPFIPGKIRRVLNKTRTFRINDTFRLK